nr:collagen alpha-1(XII) chain-like [Cherax quadricarinatus]
MNKIVIFSSFYPRWSGRTHFRAEQELWKRWGIWPRRKTWIWQGRWIRWIWKWFRRIWQRWSRWTWLRWFREVGRHLVSTRSRTIFLTRTRSRTIFLTRTRSRTIFLTRTSPGPSSSPGPGPGPSSSPGPGPGPSSSPGPGPGPSSSPGPGPGPSSSPGPGPGPSSSPGPGPGPSSSPGPGPGPSSSPGPGPGPSSSPGPGPGPSSSPGPGPGPSSSLLTFIGIKYLKMEFEEALTKKPRWRPWLVEEEVVGPKEDLVEVDVEEIPWTTQQNWVQHTLFQEDNPRNHNLTTRTRCYTVERQHQKDDSVPLRQPCE